MNRIPTLLAVAAIVASLLVGCSGASNAGGDTLCKDYLAMTDADRAAVIARMLKERNGKNSSTGDVMNERSTLDGACAPAEKQGSRIGDVTR